MKKGNFRPDSIYNVDKTGLTTVQSRQRSLPLLKGATQVGQVSFAKKGYW